MIFDIFGNVWAKNQMLIDMGYLELGGHSKTDVLWWVMKVKRLRSTVLNQKLVILCNMN